jgi:hypothetical protein
VFIGYLALGKVIKQAAKSFTAVAIPVCEEVSAEFPVSPFLFHAIVNKFVAHRRKPYFACSFAGGVKPCLPEQ